MDKFPQMLYRCPGPVEIEGRTFSTLIVEDQSQADKALADGWHETTPAAADGASPASSDTADDAKPPTREELNQKATELGLKFDGRTGDKKLADMIAAKLAEMG